MTTVADPPLIAEFNGPFRVFSNFEDRFPFAAPHVRSPEGPVYWWLTNEHYFQAGKAKEHQDLISILQAGTALDAKRRGHKIKMDSLSQSAWLIAREKVMYRGLQYKFANPILRNALLATGDAVLQEGNTWGDDFWGCVYDHEKGWVGHNRLGQLLMYLRKELKNDPNRAFG